jgi:hypothetical protein
LLAVERPIALLARYGFARGIGWQHRYAGLRRRSRVAAMEAAFAGLDLGSDIDRGDRRPEHLLRCYRLDSAPARPFDLADVDTAVDDVIVHRRVVGDVRAVVDDLPI